MNTKINARTTLDEFATSTSTEAWTSHASIAADNSSMRPINSVAPKTPRLPRVPIRTSNEHTT